MNDDKIIKFEKIITINEESQEMYTKCVLLLINFMYESNKLNKCCLTYFRIRTKDSEKSLNAKDIILEWFSELNTIQLDEPK